MSDEYEPRCHRHESTPAIANCGDCGALICVLCTVDVPEVGILCGECAMRRGGIHHRPLEQVDPVRAPAAAVPPVHESPAAVDRFEHHLNARGAVEGEDLAALLEDAGLDPDVELLDDDAIVEEITALQDHAAEEPGRHHLWRHNERHDGP